MRLYNQILIMKESDFTVPCIYTILQQISVQFFGAYKLLRCLISADTLQELLFVCPSF